MHVSFYSSKGGIVSNSFDTLTYTKEAVKIGGLSQEAAEFHAMKFNTLINETLVTRDFLKHELVKFSWIIVSAIGSLLAASIAVSHLIG